MRKTQDRPCSRASVPHVVCPAAEDAPVPGQEKMAKQAAC